MSDNKYPDISEERLYLIDQVNELPNKREIFKNSQFIGLLNKLKNLPQDKKASFGKQINDLRQELMTLVNENPDSKDQLPLDVTAPMGINQSKDSIKRLLPVDLGTVHPLMTELENVLDIFYKMGFSAVQSPELDDDYHMFTSLNFPQDHPARDDYDTFMTIQKDSDDRPYIAPAHTSTMQSRVLKNSIDSLKDGQPVAFIVPGRVFRNEDLDPRHEHTFYQIEGIYVDKGVTVGNLMATLKEFLSAYYDKEVELKTQPFYFPFTEPSFEFSIACIFCDKKGCNVCSYSGWIELLGCGMVHPNVLREAGVDPEVYTGFAFGMGFTRMVMIKYGIDDVRYFLSGRLDFLRQF